MTGRVLGRGDKLVDDGKMVGKVDRKFVNDWWCVELKVGND